VDCPGEKLRFAVKIAYVGENFYGVARQPKKRTVEGEFLNALESLDMQASCIEFASRTDAKVSAACNVFAFDCGKKPNLLALHHALQKDIAAYAIAEVGEGFHPRHARSKTYRYILRDTGLDLKKMKSCAGFLIGRHSFHNFCRRDKRGFEREIFSVEVKKAGKFVSIDICGKSFLWEMIRRIAFALQQCGQEKFTETGFKSLLSPKTDSPVPALAPQNLVLLDVDYGKAGLINKENENKVVFEPDQKILDSWSKQINENAFLLETKARVLREVAPEG